MWHLPTLGHEYSTGITHVVIKVKREYVLMNLIKMDEQCKFCIASLNA